jgi:hypothetical protein
MTNEYVRISRATIQAKDLEQVDKAILLMQGFNYLRELQELPETISVRVAEIVLDGFRQEIVIHYQAGSDRVVEWVIPFADDRSAEFLEHFGFQAEETSQGEPCLGYFEWHDDDGNPLD